MPIRAATIAVTAAAVCALALLLSPSGGTVANWREQSTVSLPDAQSDTFSMSATNSTNAVDHSQSAPLDVANEPAVTVTNSATQHQSWIDVVGTQVTIPPTNITNSLLSHVNLDYVIADSCQSGLSDPPYWPINGAVGSVGAGVWYPRSSDLVADDVLDPGATKSVCPWVRPDYAVTTSAGRRDFLLNHAGRQLDIETTVRQKSHAPATWISELQQVTTRYQVKLPPPTVPADGTVCRRTSTGAEWSSIPLPGGLYGGVYWAWPTAAGTDKIATPAVDRFLVLRRDPVTLQWRPFRQSRDQISGAEVAIDGDERNIESINSDWINNNDGGLLTPAGEWREFTVRAFLYPGDEDVFVDADWIVQLREYGDRVECGSVTRRDPQPVGLG